MKVGTDALLLGSIATFDQPASLLDLGTGTGVLSLMIAQRYRGIRVTALECDKAAFEDAQFNFSEQPFTDCSFELIEADIRTWKSDQTYDAIISNPPYFENSFKSADTSRNRARHTDDTLGFDDLIQSVNSYLSPEGTFWVILPHNEQTTFPQHCENVGLFVRNSILIHGKPNHPVRIILAIKRQQGTCEEKTLTVRDADGNYTAEYIALTREYHAKDLSARK